MNKFIALIKDENGANLIEYAVLTSLIVLAAIAAINALGQGISNEFTSIGDTISR